MSNTLSATASRLQIFNKLPRSELGKMHMPNHYHSSVRSIPMVAGNAVFLVNPYTGEQHLEGRTRITPLPLEQQATIIVPLLLEAFVTALGDNPEMTARGRPAFAPWSWSTTDAALAQAVSAKLTALGVRRELCTVLVSDEEETKAANVSWRRFYNDLASATMTIPIDQVDGNIGRVCGVCGFTPSLDVTLMRCGRCRQTWYCSKACQKADWSTHKEHCGPA